jgi:Ni2+-binding GTPase involved in maturation of urease and hydrogenase
MKVSQLMTTRPLCASPEERPEELRRLMEAARVHHLPLVDDGMLVGLWVATEEGPLVLLAPERAHETTPGADANEALAALLGDREAVVVWGEGERPLGVLTRADALRILRSAMVMELGVRHLRPVMFRLVGPAEAGKSTLLLRTIERLRRCDVAVVQANTERTEAAPSETMAGAPVLDARDAHWAKGLERAAKMLPDAQAIFVEDRDGPPVLESWSGFGGDVQVIVVPPERVAAVPPDTLREAHALVVTKLDLAPEGFDLEAARTALHEHAPHLPVFGVAALHDDRGMEAWSRWVEGQVLSRQH